MRKLLMAAVVLSLGTGCAISEIKRINQRLKDENDRLLMENRDLRARAQTADKASEDRLLLIEDLRRRLARAEQDLVQPPEASADAKHRTSAFKGIEELDVIEETNAIRLILSEKVFFRPGSAVINERGKGILDRVSRVIKQEYGGLTIRVDGHTDSTPIKKTKDKFVSNWELSTARACAVRPSGWAEY